MVLLLCGVFFIDRVLQNKVIRITALRRILTSFSSPPLKLQITFSEGQALSTITLTILADSVAELSETVEITLTHVTTVGVQDTTKGAVIDPKRARAVLTILPSDSPHGVVGWHMESLFVKVTEPEGKTVS